MIDGRPSRNSDIQTWGHAQKPLKVKETSLLAPKTQKHLQLIEGIFAALQLKRRGFADATLAILKMPCQLCRRHGAGSLLRVSRLKAN